MVIPPPTTGQKATTVSLGTKWTAAQIRQHCDVTFSSIVTPTLNDLVFSQFAPPLAALGQGKAAIVSPVDGSIYLVDYMSKNAKPETVALPDATTPTCYAPTVMDQGRTLVVPVNAMSKTASSAQVIGYNVTAPFEQGKNTAEKRKLYSYSPKVTKDAMFQMTSSVTVGAEGIAMVPYSVLPSATANVFTFPASADVAHVDNKAINAEVQNCNLTQLTNNPPAIWVSSGEKPKLLVRVNFEHCRHSI